MRRAYLYFVITFLLGMVAGGAGTFFYGWYGGHWRREFSRRHVMQNLKKELNLSEAQVQQLNQIVDEAAKKSEELHRQTDPQFRALREEARARTRQILTPEQAARFNALVRKWDERRNRPPGPH